MGNTLNSQPDPRNLVFEDSTPAQSASPNPANLVLEDASPSGPNPANLAPEEAWQARQSRTEREQKVMDFRRGIKTLPGTGMAADSEFGRGVAQGAAVMVEGVAGAGEAAADWAEKYPLVGGALLSIAPKRFKESMRRAGDIASQYRDAIPSAITDIRQIDPEHLLGDLGKYAANAIGQVAPQIASMLIPGALAGKAAQLAGAGSAVAKGIGLATSFVPAAVQEAGGNYRGIRDETGVEAPGIAMASGVISGALEDLSPARLLGKFFDAASGESKKLLWRNLVKLTAKEMIKQGGIEFGTETAQEVVSVAANKFADSTYDAVNSENAWRVLNAGLQGLFGGMGIAPYSSAVETVLNKSARAKRMNDITGYREARQRYDDQLSQSGGPPRTVTGPALTPEQAQVASAVKNDAEEEASVQKAWQALLAADKGGGVSHSMRTLMGMSSIGQAEPEYGTLKNQTTGTPNATPPIEQPSRPGSQLPGTGQVSPGPEANAPREIGDRASDPASQQSQAGLAPGSEVAPQTNVAGQEVNTNPSEAQKAAGNYKKASLKLHGLDISIENPAGSQRSGTDAEGNPWSVTLPADYGYVKGTEGKDKDHVDVYVGKNPESQQVFVVNQINPKTGKLDEHKAMLGFNSQAEAVDAYDKAFSDGSGPTRRGSVIRTDVAGFKDWLANGDMKKGFRNPEIKAAPGETARDKRLNDLGEPWNLLDAIKQLGGIATPRGYDQAKMGEYDGYADSFGYGPARALRGGNLRPDTLRDELSSLGFHFESTSDMYDAVQKESTRLAKKSDFTPEIAQEKFHDAALENKGRSAAQQKQVITVPVDELQVGDVMTVKGSDFTVKKINPDGIELQDGPKYRWQELPAGVNVYVESFKPATGQERVARPAKANQEADTLDVSDVPDEDINNFGFGPDVRQGSIAPVFYSRLTRTIEQSQQGKATGAQWKALIKNSKLGVNMAEFDLVGIGDLEDGKTYTKQEVLDYLKANEVVVKDVTLGGEPIVPIELRRFIYREGLINPQAPNEWLGLSEKLKRAGTAFSNRDDGRKAEEWYGMSALAERVGKKLSETPVPALGETHFSTYQLPGAKEGTYREVLLTVPRHTTGTEGKIWEDGHGQYAGINNPIVRLRFNERTTLDGKRMLFLEEVQAPQKGQFEKMPDIFQKNWREIAFKWALRHAAENGFDSVGWTTGEQQAERYDLSKQIKSITYTRHLDGSYDLTFTELNGNSRNGAPRIPANKLEDFVGKDVAKQITNNPRNISTIEGDNLKVGGQGLKKLYDQDFRNVVNSIPAVKKSGQKVSSTEVETQEDSKPARIFQDANGWTAQDGEGNSLGRYTSFAEAQKYNARETQQVHSLTITPAIRESVLAGQPMAALESGPKSAVKPPSASLTAQGRQGLRDALAKSSLSPQHKALLRELIDSPAGKYIDGLEIEIRDMIEGGWAGSRLGRFIQIATDSSPSTAIHELTHPIWDLVSEADKEAFRAARIKAINDLLRSPTILPNQAEALRQMLATQLSTNEFLAADLPPELYRYSNEEEFFAHYMSEQFVGTRNQSLVSKVTGWLKSLVSLLKKHLGLTPRMEDVFNNWMAGRYDPNQTLSDTRRQGMVAENEALSKAKLAERALLSKQALEEEARSHSAQVEFLLRKMAEHSPQGVNATVLTNALNELGHTDLNAIDTLATKFFVGREEFSHGIQRLAGTSLLFHYAAEVAQKFRLVEKAFQAVITRAADNATEFLSKAPKLMKRVDAKEKQADLLDTMHKLFIKGASEELAAAQKAALNQSAAVGVGMASSAVGVVFAQEKADHASAVKSAIVDIVSTLSAAADPRTAQFLFNLTSKDRDQLIVEYKKLKTDGRPAENILGWAADMLSSANNITRQLAAVTAYDLMADLRASVDALTNQQAEALAKDPARVARNMMKSAGRLSVKAQMAQEAFEALQDKLTKATDEFNTLQTASLMAQNILNDPETQAYKKQAYELGKIEDRPDHAQDVWYDSLRLNQGIPLPDGTFTPPLTLAPNTAEFEKEFQTFNQAINQIAQWIVANPDDTHLDYWRGMLRQLTDVLATSRLMAPTKFSAPLNNTLGSPLTMIKYVLDEVGSRAASKAKAAAAVFARAQELAIELIQTKGSQLQLAAVKAAQSHDFTKGWFKNNAGAIHWYHEIGNPLLASWQNPGVQGKIEGEWLRGHQITRADMEAMKAMVAVTDRGFEIVQKNMAEFGAAPVRMATTIGNSDTPVVRMAVKTTENTVTRTFSRKMVDFVRLYVKSDVATRWKMLDSRFWSLVQRHMADRANTIFDGASVFEKEYSAITAAIDRQGLKASDRTLAWLVNQLSQMRQQPPAEVATALQKEFDGMFARLAHEFERDNAGVDIETAEQKSAFTQGRKEKLAGDWLYEHGFKDHAALLNFGMGIHGYYYERAKLELEDVQRDLEATRSRKETDLQNAAKTKPEAEAKKAVLKQNKRDILLGKTFDDYERVDRLISMVQANAKLFETVHGKGNNMDFSSNALRTALGTATGSILLSEITAIRNMGLGWVYMGQLANQLTGDVAWQYAKAFRRLYLTAMPKYIGSGVISMLKMPVRALEGAHNVFLPPHDQQGVSKFARFFFPMVEELSMGLYNRIQLQREMFEKGISMPSAAHYDFLAKYQLPAQGGAVRENEMFQSKLGQMGFGALEMLWGAPLVTAVGRTTLPRFADLWVNYATMKMADDVVTTLEARLRRTFRTHQEAGTLNSRFDWGNLANPTNYLTPQETFGRLGIRAKNVTDIQHLRNIFEHSPMNWDALVMRFFNELRQGNAKASLMTPEERFEFGDLMVQEVNKATATNRPMVFKLKIPLIQMAAMLQGWNVQRWRTYVKVFSRAAVSPDMSRAMMWSAVMMLVLPTVLAMGAFGDTSTEEIVRLWYWLFRNEKRATRQPWEREGLASQARGWALSAANPIPFFQSIVNTALNDMPNRASSDPVLLAQNKVMDITRYVGNAISTGDPMYGLPQLLKGLAPISGLIINQMPEFEGTLESLNARRLWSRYGPQELLASKSSGSAGTATKLTPYGQKMENAAMSGNMGEFLAVYNEAVDVARKLGYADAEKRVQQMFKSRDPESRAFKQKLSPEQRQAVLDRANPDDRSLMEEASQRFAAAESAISGPARGGGGAGARVAQTVNGAVSGAGPASAAPSASIGGAGGVRSGRGMRLGRGGRLSGRAPRLRLGRAGRIASGRTARGRV